MRFEGLPRGGKGYREASEQIEDELYRLWELAARPARGGPAARAVPPTRDEAGPVTLPA